jgi:Flp pilus assembly protein CpaB
LDSSHGLIGEVRSGDHVDVLAGFNATNANTGAGRPQLRTLMADVLVLSAPGTDSSGKATSGSSSNVTLRVGATDAAKLAFASDNGKIWIVLRPPTGGTNPGASPVTLESLLSGSPSISSGGN